MLWLSILVSFPFSVFVVFNGGYKATPLQAARVPLLVGRSIPHQIGRQVFSFLLTWGYLPVSLTLCFVWPCLPWPSSISVCNCCGVHYLPTSMGIDIIPSTLHTCSFQGLQPHHFTWGLHPSSVDVPVDVHGRSCNFLFFHPREALLVGGWVTALPLFSCGVHFFCMGWDWYTCPMHDGYPCTRECQSLMQQEEVSFSGGCMTFCAGSSLHKRGHQLQSDAPPPKSPLLTYPWSSSFPLSIHLHSVWGCQASSSLHLSFCCSTAFVDMLLLLIGLVPPIRQSSIYTVQKLHICPHTWQRFLLWGPNCCQWWGRQSWPGA